MSILEKYSNMTPGKYWNPPAARRSDIYSKIDTYEGYFGMVKKDGYWARAIIHNRTVLIQSRGITKATGTYGTYTEQVPHIVADLLHNYPDGTVLLGEIAFDDYTSTANQVGSILRSNPTRAEMLQEQRGKLHFFIFDVLAYGGDEIDHLPFSKRFLPVYTVPKHAKYVRPIMSFRYDQSTEVLNWVLSQGGEGIMLVKEDQPYKPGSARAWSSIKVKKELGELEAKVVGVIEPTKIYEGSGLDTWNYWEDGQGNLFTRDRFLKGEAIPGLPVAVTSPYFHGRMSGVIVEYQGRRINITSGTTDLDGEFLASDRAAELIANGELYAVFTGMELTDTSVRHPSLIRLRDDIK